MDLSRVVLACSGPSLRLVDVWKPGLPVIAISTAIRNNTVAEPTIWSLADRINANHGPGARDLWRNPKVLKVVPDIPPLRRPPGENITFVDYARKKDENQWIKSGARSYMDGKLPVLRASHKTITFALGWLSMVNVQEIIICGCDLRTGPRPQQRYAYDTPHRRRHAPRHLQTLGKTFADLKLYHEAAKKRGIRMISWSPGSRLEEIMEIYHEQEAPRPTPRQGGPCPPL